MSDAVSVRLADERDLDELVGLLADCVREMQSRGLDQWDQLYPDRSTLKADVTDRSLFLATLGPGGTGRLVGAFTLNQRQDPEYAEVAWQVTAGRSRSSIA